MMHIKTCYWFKRQTAATQLLAGHGLHILHFSITLLLINLCSISLLKKKFAPGRSISKCGAKITEKNVKIKQINRNIAAILVNNIIQVEMN